jgi:hypothetical protein
MIAGVWSVLRGGRVGWYSLPSSPPARLAPDFCDPSARFRREPVQPFYASRANTRLTVIAFTVAARRLHAAALRRSPLSRL